MNGLIILYAPSSAAADAAEAQLAGGSAFGVTASLGIRQGRYLVVVCATADKPALLQGVYALSPAWRVVAHGRKLTPADLIEDEGALLAYVSGVLA